MKLKPIIFGSTGMIGQAVLIECIESPDVESILLINRRSLNKQHPKIKEIVHNDFEDMSSLIPEFKNYDTCFFCLGVTSLGLSESEYHRITYDLTVRVAEVILKTGRDFTFCYISGKSTDSTEKGKVMWARVKGKLEN
jgi:nucleoside-diphosphate-sugar epimerase